MILVVLFTIWVSWSPWLNPLQISVKGICKVSFVSYSCDAFCVVQWMREQSFLLETDRHRHRQTDKQTHTGTHGRQRHRFRLLQQTDKRMKDTGKVKQILKWLQGAAALSFLSLMWSHILLATLNSLLIHSDWPHNGTSKELFHNSDRLKRIPYLIF